MAANASTNVERRNLLVSLMFGNAAAGQLINTQQVVDFTEVHHLNEQRTKSICSTIQKPGRNANGHSVSRIIHHNRKLLVYYVHHMDHMSCPVKLIQVTLASLHALSPQYNLEGSWNNTVPDLAKLTLRICQNCWTIFRSSLKE